MTWNMSTGDLFEPDKMRVSGIRLRRPILAVLARAVNIWPVEVGQNDKVISGKVSVVVNRCHPGDHVDIGARGSEPKSVLRGDVSGRVCYPAYAGLARLDTRENLCPELGRHPNQMIHKCNIHGNLRRCKSDPRAPSGHARHTGQL